MKNFDMTKDAGKISELHAGEFVLLSGTVYTARDCAHKRLHALLAEKKPLPFEPEGAAIYYAGPCPAPEGKACGSCGPTTAARVDVFTPELLDAGVKFMVGKGERSDEVARAAVKNGCVYFAAVGGAGALYGNAVKKSELVAFPDLLSEAIYRFEIEDFPVFVAIDAHGGNIYKR